MAVQTKTFAQLVSSGVAAIQGAAESLVDMTVGSILLAVVEAFSLVSLWLQGIALQIVALTRFATSNDGDADSWGADFNYKRLGAQAAQGPATFSRFTATAQALVPVGTVVQTQDGSKKYTVVADTAKSAFDATQNAYVMAPGTSSCSATIVSLSGDASGNATAGAINTIGSTLVGVDAVTNPAGFTNGANKENDTDFRARFPKYLGALEKATPAAVEYAIESVQQGVNEKLVESQSYAGAAQLGYFYAVVDDGTGAPSDTFIGSAVNAVDAVRPIGSTFGIFPPQVITANVGMTIASADGSVHSDVVAIVQAALVAYINTLKIGQPLPFSRLAQIAYDASPAVTNVTAVSLNSGTSDLGATNKQVVKAGTVTVS